MTKISLLLSTKLTTLHFKIDDIEEAHSHVNFMQMATDRAGISSA
jgi:hypothetical protein